jgi:hypothetical protein
MSGRAAKSGPTPFVHEFTIEYRVWRGLPSKFAIGTSRAERSLAIG